jgi:hypothetical protein
LGLVTRVQVGELFKQRGVSTQYTTEGFTANWPPMNSTAAERARIGFPAASAQLQAI